MPIRPTHRASVLLHASWAIAQAHSLDWPWHDGASWAGGHSDDRSAIANVVVLEQPMLDMDRLALVGHPPLMSGLRRRRRTGRRPPSTCDGCPTAMSWPMPNVCSLTAIRCRSCSRSRPVACTRQRCWPRQDAIVVAYDDGVPLATAAVPSPATMDNLCTSGSATSDSNDGPSGARHLTNLASPASLVQRRACFSRG